jgi:hypothetical protein
MYSDYEIECLYLSRPFEEKTIHSEDTVFPARVSEKDIEQVRSAIPLLTVLVDAACVAVR